MNNYSWLQQKLHQLALSSQFMRETAFDVESTITSTEEKTDDHVFVAGLARSGTTILLNALYESNQFSSLSYQDMPFILAPNLWSKVSIAKQNAELIERAHGDGIKVSSTSPEAFEEVFWMTFDERDPSTNEKFKLYLELINHKYKKSRYLSKNNQNIRRSELISDMFPRSQILIPFRNPIQHAYSLWSQHHLFLVRSKNDAFISNYMKWIGHTEFGPNYKPIYDKHLSFRDHLGIDHWLEQWILTYQHCYTQLKRRHNIHFICYETLCSSEDYWIDILKLLNIEKLYDFEFKESHKTVPTETNKDLIEKASSLYSKLEDCSILN